MKSCAASNATSIWQKRGCGIISNHLEKPRHFPRSIARAVKGDALEIELMQDLAETKLMEAGHHSIARRYILTMRIAQRHWLFDHCGRRPGLDYRAAPL